MTSTHPATPPPAKEVDSGTSASARKVRNPTSFDTILHSDPAAHQDHCGIWSDSNPKPLSQKSVALQIDHTISDYPRLRNLSISSRQRFLKGKEAQFRKAFRQIDTKTLFICKESIVPFL